MWTVAKRAKEVCLKVQGDGPLCPRWCSSPAGGCSLTRCEPCSLPHLCCQGQSCPLQQRKQGEWSTKERIWKLTHHSRHTFTPEAVITSKKKKSMANIQQANKLFCILDFKDFHLVPEVYGWPSHLSWLSTYTH